MFRRIRIRVKFAPSPAMEVWGGGQEIMDIPLS
jgi:hypothetical protein